MKRLLLTFALLLPLGISAEEHKPDTDKLTGVWQQIQKGNKENEIIRLPVWKVMQTDGSFCTFLIANPSGQSILTNEGSFKVTSDSTVVEHITGSITDPNIVGKDNKITYRFDGKDKIHVTYRMPGASRDGHESWVRVKLEIPD